MEPNTPTERAEDMTRRARNILLGVSLLALSAFFYLVHYLIFREAHHIFIYLVGDIAFVFIEVLLVTLIIHHALEEREKRARLEKLNMVIGAFFSEVGAKLLEILSDWDPQLETIQSELASLQGQPGGQKFKRISAFLRGHDYRIAVQKPDWAGAREFLLAKRDFMLRLLENPNLLEHESFTDVLWAVFHLAEELQAREDFAEMPDTDRKHLVGDIERVYGQLALQWVAYIEHLARSYPYLFSLSLRTNPFDRSASPVVQE